MFQAHIKSKNFPLYSIKYQSGTAVQMVEGNYLLWMYAPGYLGSSETVSFQTDNGRWLKQESGSINAQEYDRSYQYMKSTAFYIRQNKFHTGYIAFESSVNAGHYLRHGAFNLMTANNDGSTLFADDASWIIRESGQ